MLYKKRLEIVLKQGYESSLVGSEVILFCYYAACPLYSTLHLNCIQISPLIPLPALWNTILQYSSVQHLFFHKHTLYNNNINNNKIKHPKIYEGPTIRFMVEHVIGLIERSQHSIWQVRTNNNNNLIIVSSLIQRSHIRISAFTLVWF